MTPQAKQYFDNLTPGKVVRLSEAKDPEAFKKGAMEYIDLYGHSIGFIQGYQAITKYYPIPTNDRINFFYNY